VADALRGRLGANPVDYVTRATGTLALLFLALTLAVTPVAKLPRLGKVVRLRRMLGLFAFFYATLHLATYVAWDQEWSPSAIAADVAKRRFVLVGMAAWLLMAPLALTSTDGMVKRLGRSWKRLHRLTYAAAGLGVLHFYLLLKVPTDKLWSYGLVIAAALAVRPALWLVKRARRARRPRRQVGGMK
jgi:sulfoxide reductase heme-binding subunit YedZ